MRDGALFDPALSPRLPDKGSFGLCCGFFPPVSQEKNPLMSALVSTKDTVLVQNVSGRESLRLRAGGASERDGEAILRQITVSVVVGFCE